MNAKYNINTTAHNNINKEIRKLKLKYIAR